MLVLCDTVIDVLALGVAVKDVEAVNDNDEVEDLEMLLVVVALALFVMVELVIGDLLTDSDQEGVTDVVKVSNAEIVDDSETLRDNEPVSSCETLWDSVHDTDVDMEVVGVELTLDDNDKLNDNDDEAL